MAIPKRKGKPVPDRSAYDSVKKKLTAMPVPNAKQQAELVRAMKTPPGIAVRALAQDKTRTGGIGKTVSGMRKKSSK